MPVTNSWDNDEKTIIRMEIAGRWTWDEMYQASDAGYTMLESVPHIVYPIIDMRQSQAIPGNAITHASGLMRRQHPRTGMSVFVGANTIVVSLWRAFVHVYSLFSREQDFKFANSLDEARQLIADAMQQEAQASGQSQAVPRFPNN